MTFDLETEFSVARSRIAEAIARTLTAAGVTTQPAPIRQTMAELMAALGFPRHVKSFSLSCGVDCLPEINCVFIATDRQDNIILNDGMIFELERRFRLVPRAA